MTQTEEITVCCTKAELECDGGSTSFFEVKARTSTRLARLQASRVVEEREIFADENAADGTECTKAGNSIADGGAQ